MLLYIKKNLDLPISEFQSIHDDNSREQSVSLNIREYPELDKKFVNMITGIRPDINEKEHYTRTFTLVKMGVNDRRVKKNDMVDSPKNDAKKEVQRRIRRFVALSIIKKSDDLEGGNILIYSHDGYMGRVPLEVGDTLLFSAETHYEIESIKTGNLAYVVAYIHRHG